MLICKCYNVEFSAKDVTDAKRKASKIANGYINPIDKLEITSENGTYIYRRFNKKSPWNEIERGKWI